MFIKLFTKTVENYPDHPALSWQHDNEELGLTYKELDEKSTLLAYYLQQLGIKSPSIISQTSLEEPIVVIRSGRENPFWVISMIASWKSGAAVVLLDKSLSLEECQRRINDLDPRAEIGKVFIDNESTLAEFAKTTKRTLINICDDEFVEMMKKQASTTLVTELSPDHLAYIAYTSSTSCRQGEYPTPKAVAINHAAIAPVVEAYKNAMQIKLGDRMLQASSFHFDACYAEVFCLAMSETAITLVLPSNPEKLLFLLPEVIEQQNITLLTAVPSVLEQHVNKLKSPLRHIVSTGEAGREDLFQQLRNQGIGVSNGYGPSEHGVGSTVAVGNTTSIGEAMLEKKIFLCKDVFKKDGKKRTIDSKKKKIISYKKLQNNDKGEIVIAGRGLARGYIINGEIDKAATKKKFVEFKDPDTNEKIRGYFTGDMARYQDGLLHYLDRVDNQLKISGVRIELKPIAHATIVAIKELTYKEAGFHNIGVEVVPQKIVHENGHAPIKKIVGFISTENDKITTLLDVMTLRQKLEKNSLPRIAIPNSFYLLSKAIIDEYELKTNSGKIRTKKLADLSADSDFLSKLKQLPYFTGKVAENSFEEVSVHEEKIITICRNALGLTDRMECPFSLNTNLEDYGATSLDLLPLKQALEHEFDVDLNIRPLLLEDLTIKSIVADIVRRKLFQEAYKSIDKTKDTSDKKPIFCIHPVSGDCAHFLHLDIKTNQELIGLKSPYLLSNSKDVKGLELKPYVDLYYTKYQCTTLEEIATYAVYGLQTIVRHGPYDITGFSMGGALAMAIAAQLDQIGEKINWLGLIDPPFPDALRRSLTQSSLGVSKVFEVVHAIAKKFNIVFNLNENEIPDTDTPETKLKKIFAEVRNQLEEQANTNERPSLQTTFKKALCVYTSVENHLLALAKFEFNTQITNAEKICLYHTKDEGMIPLGIGIDEWDKYAVDICKYEIEGDHLSLLSNKELHKQINSDLNSLNEFIIIPNSNIIFKEKKSKPELFGNSRNLTFAPPKMKKKTIYVSGQESKEDLIITASDKEPSIVAINNKSEKSIVVTAIDSTISKESGEAVSNILANISKFRRK